jgi:hypothetical protein
MHVLVEAELSAVEIERRIDVVDELPDADFRHVGSSPD